MMSLDQSIVAAATRPSQVYDRSDNTDAFAGHLPVSCCNAASLRQIWGDSASQGLQIQKYLAQLVNVWVAQRRSKEGPGMVVDKNGYGSRWVGTRREGLCVELTF